MLILENSGIGNDDAWTGLTPWDTVAAAVSDSTVAAPARPSTNTDCGLKPATLLQGLRALRLASYPNNHGMADRQR